MKEMTHCFVLEIETGFMDGTYQINPPNEDMAKVWDKTRPNHTHVMVYTNKFFRIPDNKFLANKHYGIKGQEKS